jgi:hypothetical protein|tara:strand:- start:158 stop:310 length:153 start_codon:yes stop_codon:yes gene_type:complete
MKESKSELDATYEKVMEAFDRREHRQKRMNLMILGLYAVIVITMFVGAWL